jgi:hypothetical protein
MSNFSKSLEQYDKLLIQKVDSLNPQIINAINLLEDELRKIQRTEG